MTTQSPLGALVDVHWLDSMLANPALVILDASWHMPSASRDAAREFLDVHVPGARFFDFDRTIRDHRSSLPHMLPDPAEFQQAAQDLGISQESIIVCYDSAGIFSAPRAWWMFKAMGFRQVAVLDGGLPAWRAEGFRVDRGPGPSPVRGDWLVNPRQERVACKADVIAALSSSATAILDARSPGRFQGIEPEPRTGLRGGHMPGACNLPFGMLLHNGHFRSSRELAGIFDSVGVPTRRRLICSCGSGVTACILALAADLQGYENVAVYDGSWAEWGACSETPVVCADGR